MKALLTGHTRGLGAALAEELLARGIPVLGLARAGNAALAARYPGKLTQISLDLADTDALLDTLASAPVARFIADARELLLINNAGVVQPVGPLDTQDAAAIARALSLNVTTPLILSSVLAAQRAQRPLRILQVSSGAGRNAYPGWSIYCATKAALDQHARAVTLDRTPGIRICSLAPGVIDTDMQTEIRAIPAEKSPMRDRFIRMKQEGTLTQPADAAARMVAYLLSDDFGSAPIADLRELKQTDA